MTGLPLDRPSRPVSRQESRATRPTSARPGPRRDIQGLRAFAVLAVVLDHLLGWPRGGFVGVDVFFVISGFLITGLLLREQEQTGSISFRTFYRRRVKRILPAAVVVIAATVLGSWLVFATSRFRTTVEDAVYALLFAGNWRFATGDTDYFAQGRPPSPLQQFWSLGVEEQFYFVWPWLLLLIYAGLAQQNMRRGDARLVVGAVMAVLTVASFAWALRETAEVPTRAYFSTLSRTWELGIGALLAVAAPLLVRLPTALRPVLSWTGLLGMTVSLWVITPDGFPAPAAALPVLSTALVIAAGTGVDQQRFLAPLTNRVSGYVGDISYSLYLWHFPIIILGTAVWGSGALALSLLAIAIVAASVYSYHLLEDPIRRSSWLEGGARPREPGRRRLTKAQKDGWTSLLLVLCVLLLVGLQRSVPDHSPPTTTRDAISAGPAASPGEELQDQLRQALQANAWPELSPPIDDVVGAAQAPDDVLACGTRLDLDPGACAFGPEDADKTAVVVGDSIAMTYVETLREALPDWRIYSRGGFGCTFTSPLIANPDRDLEAACPDRKRLAVETILEVEPDLVLITNIQFPRQPVGAEEPLSEAQWAESTLELVEQFRSSVGTVVFVAPPPADKDLNDCYTRVSTPNDCVSLVTEQWEQRATTERAMAEQVDGAWLDSSRWFCVDGRCPAFAGNTPTKVDATHMTPSYAAKIAPVVLEDLRARGLV